MRRGSSRRLTRWPTSFGSTGAAIASSESESGLSDLVRRVLDGIDDVLVARAAAEVAGDRLADFSLGWLRVVVEEVDRRHDHARRAVAALEAVLFPEPFLQRVKPAVGGEA